MAERPRTIIYIDGFNLYYGAVKGTAHKWLNLQRYFEMIRQNDDLVAIKYFTALITGPTRPNQDIYMRALATLPLVSVYLGKFTESKIECGVRACTHEGRRKFTRRLEKGTDVNIAVHMLNDAYQDRCDQLVLVTADSDLAPALRIIRETFPDKKTFVYVPPGPENERGAAVELRAAAHRNKTLPLNLLPKAQFRSEVHDSLGKAIKKPSSW
jgi:uncharacterized LabA/DUF88 family protein